MLRNLSLTLIAVAVLSACGSSGGGSGVGGGAGTPLAGGFNQADSGAGNADDGASGNSGASLIAPNKNNTNNQNPNPTPTPAPTPTPTPAPLLMPFSETTWLNNRSKNLQELTIDGKTYRYRDKRTSVDNDTINMAELGMGFSTRQVEYSITPTVDLDSINLDPSKKDTAKGILTVYQRPYSAVHSLMLPGYDRKFVNQFNKGCETDATAASCKLDDGIINTFGHLTPSDVIQNFAENNQKFSYSGEAFTVAPVPERGVFKYQVNFGTGKYATSSGSITGFNSVGDITLGNSVPVYSNGISGTATESKKGRIGSYTLEFFGPNAEEVAGKGIIPDTGKDANGRITDTIFGFSGVR
ncbi:factor H binding protein domain-containing protein [Kingella sp. (in: b-proteobacteria)]|uniref:factor H binding protein domain-containing protein n=1 Tax=Kingella sp. (in: b-proteobacteria) TaxID=2020713 RepID=UPI0026DD531D|nr:factor H binding protein domain-containing protein [Kingella sp. (in: b-proteobacteria)]MDO4658193.1 hypothetical protein [Kingella sp. (in: b-proteobacteria)]